MNVSTPSVEGASRILGVLPTLTTKPFAREAPLQSISPVAQR